MAAQPRNIQLHTEWVCLRVRQLLFTLDALSRNEDHTWDSERSRWQNETTRLLSDIRNLMAKMSKKQTDSGTMFCLPSSGVQTVFTERLNLPIQQSDPRNSVAWRALKKSHDNTVEPEIERWRGGLDATLVFVCLNSPFFPMLTIRLPSLVSFPPL